ncbi:dethiobiotin synthase [Halomonas borealis]|uniref:dethiobiotin synthase n=1 Tax=Halomonas borealis TaxID=2508710 RepID=UPI0010A09DA8|nr:dethiobiotin synthase [Halomonas borealis]
MTCVTLVTPFAVPAAAKWAFTTRRVKRDDVHALVSLDHSARAGDLILYEILQVGQHKRLQLACGRPSESYPGDLVVVCVGDRYAPDQFMGRAEVDKRMDLLAGGGIAGKVEAAHARMARPTQLRPLGFLADAWGEVVNIDRYAIVDARIPDDVVVLGVFGASMNAGKTTAAVSLAHGLKRAGFAVEGVKATGTGAFGDFNAFADASVAVSDFTDAGMASTFRCPLTRIERGFEALVGGAASRGAEVVVVEIADGVFQDETAAILADSAIIERLDGILFAAPDALGAVGGVAVLKRHGLRPFALAGMLSLSTLGSREASGETGLPVVKREALCDPEAVSRLVAPIMKRRVGLSVLKGPMDSERLATGATA